MTPTNPFDRVRNNARAFFPGKDVFAVSDEALAPAVKILKDAQSSMGAPKGRAAFMNASNPRAYASLLSELALGTCNFCYWSGRANFLPAGGSSNLMADIAYDAYRNDLNINWDSWDITPALPDIIIGRAIELTATSGFPLIERRVANLREILQVPAPQLFQFLENLIHEKPLADVMNELLTLMPMGFAGDVLLKRALLFLHQIHREFGLYSREAVANLPIPADYQVPKMLQAYGTFTYSDRLQKIIDSGDLIAPGSLMELEIRSATILTADRLATLSDMTIGEIDWALWFTRKSVKTPYHLTITTDY